MRPFAAACQPQIRHFHSFIRVFWDFGRFYAVFYNFAAVSWLRAAAQRSE
jgi:hypothetical protein